MINYPPTIIIIISILILSTSSFNLHIASSTTRSPRSPFLPRTLLSSTPTPPNTPDENGDLYDDPNAPLYDDQVDYKAPELSDSMKARLKNEAQSFGADYNTKSPPYILYISGFIVLLIAVGGQGIFF